MNKKTLTLKSYAKLNLFLQVRGKRADNYHTIQTVFERIDIHDRITLKDRSDRLITMQCSDPSLSVDESNLCVRSARLVQEKYAPGRGVDIILTKHISIGAGMGGGSSNAATVLAGLNALWKLNIPLPKLVGLGRRIGADVPFFLYDVSFAVGSGRGDSIKPLIVPRKTRFWHVVVVPRIHVSTPLIYREWDRFEGLTRPVSNVKLWSLLLQNYKVTDIGKSLFNALETVTISRYPDVLRCREALIKSGIDAVLMSGSGPSVFGITQSLKAARSTACALTTYDSNWRIFVTKTV